MAYDKGTSVLVSPLDLDFVGPADLKRVWPFVRAGIEKVKSKTGAEWLPEDVYAHLKAGTVSLLVAKRWSQVVGFAILTMTVNPFSGEKVAVIWICQTDDRDVVNVLLPQVEGLCKSQGCVKVSFQSPRLGWKRRLAKQGYVLREYVYDKRI